GNNFGQGSSVVTLQVRIVSQKATTVKLTFKDINRDTTFNIPANSVYTYNLNTVEKAAVYLTATGTSNKSLRIQSTEEISVYALNQYINTTDATFILPVDVLGTDYYQLSYNHVNDYEFYAVIATEDNTTIYENNASTVTLQSGEVYSLYTNADITGYHITSNKPVAYFVIRTCAPIPANITACDHLYEQMTPVSSWGKIFVIPVTKRGVERVRIVASQDGTIITQTGGVIKIDGGGKNSLNLDRGEFVEMEIYLDSGGCYISSDKPVGVASYLVGMNHPELKYGKGTVGDPALTVIPPIEQMVFSADIAPFIPSIGTALTEHYVMVITPTTTCNQTTVTIGNGSPTSLSGGSWIAGNGLGAAYSFYTMPLTSATDAYHFSNPNGLFVMGFGLGERETYYYLSGAAMRTLEASFTVDDNHYQTLNGQTICVGSAVNFRASGISPEAGVTGYLKWYIDEIEQTSQTDVLQWTGSLTNGEHTVRIDVTDKCRTYSFETTFEVINRAVASDITAKDTTICYNTTANLTISAPNVTNSNYKWYSSQTATTPFHTEASYTTSHLTADTTFYVSVSGDNYCENDTGKRKAVTVSVYAPLEAGFISPTESRHCYRVSTLNIDLGTYPLSGGSGNYFYQWESSTDGIQWQDIGIPTQTYNISGLTETKYYRRAVVDAVCGTVYSDIDTVYYVRAIPYFLTEICPGLTVRISPSTNGLWESSDPSIMEVVNNNSIVGINPCAAKLTFYDSLAGGCNTPIDIKVNAYPVPDEITASAKVVCIGKTIELSNTTSGGRWTKNNDNISFDNPQANPVKVTGETKGNSFVTYTVSNFGCQTKRTFRLKVIPDSPPSKIIIGIER
ncbi:MAG: hypothetical protein LBG80_01525, partial [Bacteroidales bacterium]|nr:hypothetical protein [Bacteroidales bacterium]